jgi:hypothetical protein
MLKGIDLATGPDTTVLLKQVKINHKCGHIADRNLCAYSFCVDTKGRFIPFEKQIYDKIKYFERLNCLDCKAKELISRDTDGTRVG